MTSNKNWRGGGRAQRAISFEVVHQLIANESQNCGLSIKENIGGLNKYWLPVTPCSLKMNFCIKFYKVPTVEGGGEALPTMSIRYWVSNTFIKVAKRKMLLKNSDVCFFYTYLIRIFDRRPQCFSLRICILH